MGLLGTRGLYLKQPAVALDLSRIDTVVFDKTGTLTDGSGADDGRARRPERSAGYGCGGSRPSRSHPASRAIAAAAVVRERRCGRRPTASRARGRGRGRSAASSTGMRVAIGTRGVRRGADRHRRVAPPTTRPASRSASERGWMRVARAAAARDRATPSRALGARPSTLSAVGRPRRRTPTAGRRSSAAACTSGSRPRTSSRSCRARRAARPARADGRRRPERCRRASRRPDVGIAVSDDTACLAPACDARDRRRPPARRCRPSCAYARRARQVDRRCASSSRCSTTPSA